MTPRDVVTLLVFSHGWRLHHDRDHDGETWIASRGPWEVYACRLDTGAPRWLWSIYDGKRFRADGEDIDAAAAEAALRQAVLDYVPSRLMRAGL